MLEGANRWCSARSSGRISPRLWELVGDFEVALCCTRAGLTAVIRGVRGALRPGPVERAEGSGLLRDRSGRRADRICGLHRIDYFSRSCELGIGIGREYWGKGFGQDGVRTLVDYAFEHLNLNRVGLYTLAEDPRAVGAYRKAGFVEEGRIRQHASVRGQDTRTSS